MSHKDRYANMSQEIPYEDSMLISPYLAGFGRRAWIDESKNTFMGEIELANNDNGKLIKDLLKKGFDIGTSMSVSATADDQFYYVDEILSLGDFTLRPDLEAKVVKIDFSEKIAPNGTSNLVTFSQTIKNKDIVCNFSDESDEEENDVDCCPVCGGEIDNCKCVMGTGLKKGVRREGYSQSNSPRPNVTKPEHPKLDVNKVRPVENTQVAGEEVVTNLNSTVAGESVENINPEYFNTKLFASLGITESDNVNVSMDEIHEGIPSDCQLDKLALARLPNEMTTVVDTTVKNNFSVQQYMAEMNMQPYAILFRRINEIIQLCRSKKQEWITQNLDKLKSYFDSYVLTWINASLDDMNKEFNIAIGLRLMKYNVEQKKLMRLNRVMKRMRKQVETTGWITKPIQQELNSAYQDIENDLYKFIDDKIKPQGVTFFPSNDNNEE